MLGMLLVPTFFILFMCISSSATISLLSKISSNKLYNECQQMSGSELFKKMIEKLSYPDKIPILVEADEDNSALWDDVNYAKRLSGIQSFMAEVKLNKKVLKNPPIGPKHWSDPKGPTKKKLAYDRAEIFRYQTHRDLMKMMEKILSTKESLCGLESMITVENILEKALECAVRVHQTRKQKMPKEIDENGNKVTSEMWINLDKKFKEELQKICFIKVVKKDNKAVEDIGAVADANANAKAEH